ncbi:hypothetical protein A2U01_0079051, partial [Trifolium medium]|nr:hypothetical protein [Trifolium medium]
TFHDVASTGGEAMRFCVTITPSFHLFLVVQAHDGGSRFAHGGSVLSSRFRSWYDTTVVVLCL